MADYFPEIESGLLYMSDKQLKEKFQDLLRNQDSKGLTDFLMTYGILRYDLIYTEILINFSTLLQTLFPDSIAILIKYLTLGPKGQDTLVGEFDAIIGLCNPEAVKEFAYALAEFDTGKRKIIENYDVLIEKCGDLFLDDMVLLFASYEVCYERLIEDYPKLFERLRPDTVAKFTAAFSKIPLGKAKILKDYNALLKKCSDIDKIDLAKVFASFPEGQVKILLDYQKIKEICRKNIRIGQFVQAFSSFKAGQNQLVADYPELLGSYQFPGKTQEKKWKMALDIMLFIKGYANFEEGLAFLLRDYDTLLAIVQRAQQDSAHIGNPVKDFHGILADFGEGRVFLIRRGIPLPEQEGPDHDRE
ncbi:MAG: hypothetical protein FWC53_02880 [Firmicutes bacterium]|nr:hypothetical protein [Bacillota bacterium]